MITVSLRIENTYARYPTVVTHIEMAEIPAPPTLDETTDAYHDWAAEHIREFCGAGNIEGDAWHDIMVTGSSEPQLIGRTFAYGY